MLPRKKRSVFACASRKPRDIPGLRAGLGNVCVGCKLIRKNQKNVAKSGKQIINSDILLLLFARHYKLYICRLPTCMQKFEDHIKRIITIPDSDLEKIVSCFQTMTVDKNEHLVKTGQPCDCYYFVEKGSLRIYTEVNGMEITSWYVFESYFFTELESYTYQCASKYNIQAIESTTLLYIPRKAMNELLHTYPAWNDFLRKTWEQAFLKLSQVVLSFHTLKGLKADVRSLRSDV